MKIPNKKIIKPLLTLLYGKALKFFYAKYTGNDKFKDKVITDIIKRTFEIIESAKSSRSNEQNSLYHIMLLYLQYHVPDTYVEAFNNLYKTNRKIFSKDYWHITFKDSFGKESTAFDKQDGHEFTEYFNAVMQYVADNIFYCKVDDLQDDIKEFYDTFNKGRIDLF